ncbi:hypothetical protein [Rothia nasimurium]|uniref:hypothetical protein n=1 Tax=Rothia nasimurium TaxID=85336 RepID=UPI001F1DEC86|nr:hypothetical protein [Rothia nasimurium]
METYTTINNVIGEYVVNALGTEANNYDMKAIAQEIAEYQPELNGFTINEDNFDFWEVATRHELQA